MTNYTDQTTVEALTGISFNDDAENPSRPSLTALNVMLGLADNKINGEMKQTANITDDYGALKPIATALVIKMINNIMFFAEPNDYAYVEAELTKDDIRTIHYTYSVWQSKHWEMGIDT